MSTANPAFSMLGVDSGGERYVRANPDAPEHYLSVQADILGLAEILPGTGIYSRADRLG